MKLTPIARCRMRASPGPGSGTGTSSQRNTSGPPCSWIRIAYAMWGRNRAEAAASMRSLEHGVEPPHDLLLRHGADDAVQLAAVAEDEERRDAADPEARRRRRVLVHVEL